MITATILFMSMMFFEKPPETRVPEIKEYTNKYY